MRHLVANRIIAAVLAAIRLFARTVAVGIFRLGNAGRSTVLSIDWEMNGVSWVHTSLLNVYEAGSVVASIGWNRSLEE